MNSLNKASLIGMVGKDPEVKQLEGGSVAKFSLATGETYKDRDGNKHERTEWHNITCWNKLADIAGNIVRKGSQVYVEGSIKYRTWGEGDQKKTATEIVADTVLVLGKKPANE